MTKQLENLLLVVVSAAIVAVGCVDDPPKVETGPDATNSADVGTDLATSSDTGNSASDAGQADMGPPTYSPSRTPKRTREGLLAYYPFRATDLMQDESGGGRSFDTPDGAAIAQGTLQLPPSRTFTLPDDTPIRDAVLASQEFTLELWVSVPNTAPARVCSWNELQIARQNEPDGRFVDLCIYGCFQDSAAFVGGAWAITNMQHVVVTGRGDVLQLYVDGALVGAWHDLIAIDDLFMGPSNVEFGSESSPYQFGLIALYDRALSPGEVLQHHLVGPNPTSTDEVEAADPEAAVLVSDGVLHGDVSRAVTIEEGNDRNQGGLSFRPARRGLYFAEHDVPESAEVLAARLQMRSFAVTDANNSTFTIAELARPWNTNANWTQTGTGENWQQPGAAGAGDQVSPRLDSFGIAVDDALDLDLEIGERVWSWQQVATDEGPPFGFLMECENCTVFQPVEESPEIALRPRIVTLLAMDPERLAEPATPEDIAVNLADDQLRVTWMQQDGDVLHEVYVNGRLQGRTFRSFFEMPFDSSAPSPAVVVYAVDLLGRRSAPAVAP
jgi:hypothetical protein